MGKSSTTVTAGLARVEALSVLRHPDRRPGVELMAYARLVFRPFGGEHDLTIMFYPKDPDSVRFLMDVMQDRDTVYMEIANLRSPIPFFDRLAEKLGFRTHWISTYDVVQMNLGDRPIRMPL